MEEQENILDMVQCSPTTNMQRLSARIGVSRTCVWRTLHQDGLYPYHPEPVQNLHPGDSAMLLEFCHWLHTNRSASVMFTMPFTFSVAEYADMIYLYGFCDSNSVHVIAEYQQRFLNRRIPT